MELYSYKGAFPYPLPSDMSKYDINDFTLASAKPSLAPGQILGWNGVDWVVNEPNESEIEIQWQTIRDRRLDLLKASDVSVIRSVEAGIPVSDDVKAYRQSLRDVTQQPNPFDITWPVDPTNTPGVI
jgi:hypothetical protein